MTIIKIMLTERRPVTIDDANWPLIASAQNLNLAVFVRQNANGRRIVNGTDGASINVGFIIEPVAKNMPTEDATVVAIDNVCRVITGTPLSAKPPTLVAACINNLPPENLDSETAVPTNVLLSTAEATALVALLNQVATDPSTNVSFVLGLKSAISILQLALA